MTKAEFIKYFLGVIQKTLEEELIEEDDEINYFDTARELTYDKLDHIEDCF